MAGKTVNEVSDKLAISAAFSVLMMSMFVLFGTESTQVEFGPAAAASHSPSLSLTAPALVSGTGASLLSLD
jgi:hypothetical protein